MYAAWCFVGLLIFPLVKIRSGNQPSEATIWDSGMRKLEPDVALFLWKWKRENSTASAST